MFFQFNGENNKQMWVQSLASSTYEFYNLLLVAFAFVKLFMMKKLVK